MHVIVGNDIIKELIMPIGIFLLGFLTSSLKFATESNPTYAKNTVAAPANTPLAPNMWKKNQKKKEKKENWKKLEKIKTGKKGINK